MKNARYLKFVVSALIVCVFCGPVYAASEHTEALNRTQWPEYENGPNILGLKSVSTILQRYEEHDKVRLEIRYPGGDAGRIWAENLSSWFVAFGVPRRYQELLPGSGAPDWLVIALIDRR